MRLLPHCAELEVASGDTTAGMQSFYTGFSTTFLDSVSLLRTTSAGLYASCLELLTAAGQIDVGCTALSSAAASMAAGADDLSAGTSEAADAMPEMISAISDMIAGVEELKDGLESLNNDGLHELKDGLDGLDGYLQTLSDKADAYGSFMDERNADIGTVQFILKTEGIYIN